MELNLYSFYILIYLFCLIHSEIADKEKEKIYEKVIKKINYGKIGEYDLLTQDSTDNKKSINIGYDKNKIKSIINKYGFPQNYNFLTATNCISIVKDQGECGSCWSFASTTALSYRFHKKGIDIDLSPQYPLSCFHRECNNGTSSLEAFMNLNKNGTVTERCLPYSSVNSFIEHCPNTCKDGANIKKYHSKNTYTTIYDYSEENYYDIVTVIIDQLINYGPVVSSIYDYEDFQLFHLDSNCKNRIYSYDGISEYIGGHAIVIVGYGYENSKFYWIIQNSWGNVCDNGFIKFEFGQAGIERVTFAEAKVSDSNNIDKITVNFEMDGNCNLDFKITSSFANFKDNFDITFSKNEDKFYYQCGYVDLYNESKSICYLQYFSYADEVGLFTIQNYEILGTQNQYIFDNSFNFYYYGYELIYTFWESNFYVSEKGSIITLLYYPTRNSQIASTRIYPNILSPKPLEKCYYQILGAYEFNIIYCIIQENELQYFKNSSDDFSDLMSYDINCGIREIIDTSIFLLDKTIYALVRVKKFFISTTNTINRYSTITLLSTIEGCISNYKEQIYYFYIFIRIEKNQFYYRRILICYLNKPSKLSRFTNIVCNGQMILIQQLNMIIFI